VSDGDEPGIRNRTVAAFLDSLGSDAPTPGGGAAGAISAATGCALIAMVGRLTVGKKGFEEIEERMRSLVDTADAARLEFLRLADADAHAFDGVMAAFKMPKETDEEKTARSAAIQTGYEKAGAVPLQIARKAVALMTLAENATATGNPLAASDGLSGASSLYCGALCAIANVEINAAALTSPGRRAQLLDELAGLKALADYSLRASETAFQLRLSY
jgi:formiminotetrahydrofolate cyclodeaminase